MKDPQCLLISLSKYVQLVINSVALLISDHNPPWHSQDMGRISVFLLTVFLCPQVWGDLEYFNVGKRAVFDIIPAGASVFNHRIKEPQVLYSLSDFEMELKKRVQETPTKNALKKEIKQYFKTKNGKAQGIPIKKEWKKEIGQLIRKIQTKRHRTISVYI